MDNEANAMTDGQKLVGASFNPSGNTTVGVIKDHFAQLIDLLTLKKMELAESEEAQMIYDTAIKEAITAQMWAVKAVTYQH